MTTDHQPRHAALPRPRTCAASALAVLVLATASTGTLAVPAHAHTDLLASSPAAGDVVPASTDRLILSFAQEVVPTSGHVTVVGPGGTDVTAGDVDVQGTLVEVPLELSASGSHTVTYRVVAADGHVATGDFTFAATGGAALAPARDRPTGVEAAGQPGTPRPWWWSGAAGVVGAALVALHVARRRRLRAEVDTADHARPRA